MSELVGRFRLTNWFSWWEGLKRPDACYHSVPSNEPCDARSFCPRRHGRYPRQVDESGAFPVIVKSSRVDAVGQTTATSGLADEGGNGSRSGSGSDSENSGGGGGSGGSASGGGSSANAVRDAGGDQDEGMVVCSDDDEAARKGGKQGQGDDAGDDSGGGDGVGKYNKVAVSVPILAGAGAAVPTGEGKTAKKGKGRRGRKESAPTTLTEKGATVEAGVASVTSKERQQISRREAKTVERERWVARRPPQRKACCNLRCRRRKRPNEELSERRLRPPLSRPLLPPLLPPPPPRHLLDLPLLVEKVVDGVWWQRARLRGARLRQQKESEGNTSAPPRDGQRRVTDMLAHSSNAMPSVPPRKVGGSAGGWNGSFPRELTAAPRSSAAWVQRPNYNLSLIHI